MAMRIVRLGSEHASDEGPRIGTVRSPPRGVPKAAFTKAFRAEMAEPDASRSLDLLATLA